MKRDGQTNDTTMTMQETKVINLLDFTSLHLKQNWLNTFDAVLTDCDGVLWHEHVAIEKTPEFIAALQALGKRIYLVTNNGVKTRRDIWQRATGLGYNVAESDVLLPSHGVAQYLADLNFKQRVYLMGSPAIGSELDAMGIRHFGTGPDMLQDNLGTYIKRELTSPEYDDVGAVVMGFDEHFSFCKVLKASHFLTRNPHCHFLATNADVVFKCPNSIRLPDTGAMLKAVETCVGRQPLQMGKPNRIVCEHLIRDGSIKPERTLMIGDSAKVDVAFGKNCGFQTLLVGCGQTQWSEVEDFMHRGPDYEQYIPQYYIPTLGDLLPLA